MTTAYGYQLWIYPRGGEHENDRERRGGFGTLAEAIAASDFPNSDCWDQSAIDTWQLDDPVIEAAGRQYSWWAIERESKQADVDGPIDGRLGKNPNRS
ncbi:hypothetical protein [Streptomyces javensis]|uniref:Uncharacterized protein n=1 Tax=Streptomyces javensis TaxID=114698 RepID=A0ABS0R5R1_9ACTN|nr:hypothetical protein [Streptomyces javensis]MBI0312719.1 hypothetical protein [Streptomyces javensis]